jgi:hypothetical protein
MSESQYNTSVNEQITFLAWYFMFAISLEYRRPVLEDDVEG